MNSVRAFCDDTKVFVTYAHRDEVLVRPLIQKLVDKDYPVWENKIKPEEYFVDTISSTIGESAKTGFHIAFLTENSVSSPHCINELRFSYEIEGHIIPVIIGNPDIYGLQFLIDWDSVYHYESMETIDQIMEDLDKTLARMAAESIQDSVYKLIMEQYCIDLSKLLQE